MTSQLFDLSGQTALITGGTRGIGRSMAIALAEAGADIILVQRNENNLDTKNAIEALGRKVSIYIADLSSSSDVQALVPKILADGHEVRLFVSNAGIQKRVPAADFPLDDWNEVLQVNLHTCFILSRDIGKHMLGLSPLPSLGRKGSIIHLGSLLSFQGGITVPAYAAAKGAVAQLTKAQANEWTGQGVTVNCIAPGYIATDMNEALLKDEERQKSILARIPAQRWGEADDFKGPVVFLASKASGYVSGHLLTIDGGWMGR